MAQVAFIGGGNMATSIIGGLLKQGDIKANAIHVSDPVETQRAQLASQFGIKTFDNNLDAIKNADVVILAVKPQMMKEVLAPLQTLFAQRQPLLISIAAGINIDCLSHWSGCKAIVRCMPNTPALVGLGATGLFANAEVTIDQRNQADSLLRSVGITLWVKDEAEIDAVTAVSGSGPAYYFLLMEAMINAGVKLGLSEETSRQLTLQTALGAGHMAMTADVPPAELRRRVTSPNGTTERAINAFEQANFHAIVQSALQAANDRAGELSEQLGQA